MVGLVTPASHLAHAAVGRQAMRRSCSQGLADTCAARHVVAAKVPWDAWWVGNWGPAGVCLIQEGPRVPSACPSGAQTLPGPLKDLSNSWVAEQGSPQLGDRASSALQEGSKQAGGCNTRVGCWCCSTDSVRVRQCRVMQLLLG